MKRKRLLKLSKSFEGLQCSACSNTELFIEIMDCESHLVDGRLNYLHLIEAVTDHYKCYDCGESIALEVSQGK